mgnify:CR=1 FL=1
MDNTDLLIKTEIKSSTIAGAGKGRFFLENCKRGTIIRIQLIGSELLTFNSVSELKDANKDLTINFGHSKSKNSTIDTDTDRDTIYINNVPLYTNHSLNNNIAFLYFSDRKITYTTRDVYSGEEILQNYCDYTEVPWYEDYLHSIGEISLREFGERDLANNSEVIVGEWI